MGNVKFKRNHKYLFFNYTTYLFGITIECICYYLMMALMTSKCIAEHW